MANPPIYQSGGAGNYTFNRATQACVGTIDGLPDAFTIEITSSGVYSNSQCFPALWLSSQLQSTTASATIIQSLTGHSGETFPMPYVVNLAAGVGSLQFVSPASGAGVVEIIPTSPQDPPLCTTTFAIEGEFSVSVP